MSKPELEPPIMHPIAFVSTTVIALFANGHDLYS